MPLLLLYRFAPICNGDDAAVIATLLERAWATVDAVSAEVVAARIERADHRGDGFRWRAFERTFVLEQDAVSSDTARAMLYTLRNSENASFPFAPFEDLMRRVRERV